MSETRDPKKAKLAPLVSHDANTDDELWKLVTDEDPKTGKQLDSDKFGGINLERMVTKVATNLITDMSPSVFYDSNTGTIDLINNTLFKKEFSALTDEIIPKDFDVQFCVDYYALVGKIVVKYGDAKFPLSDGKSLKKQILTRMERMGKIIPIKGKNYSFHLEYLSKDLSTYYTVTDDVSLKNMCSGDKKVYLRMQITISN